jgi:hypothetical protein
LLLGSKSQREGCGHVEGPGLKSSRRRGTGASVELAKMYGTRKRRDFEFLVAPCSSVAATVEGSAPAPLTEARSRLVA